MSSPEFVYTLSVQSGPLAGREFPLGKEGDFTIGREYAALDVALRDDRVSREHARLTLYGAQVHFRDLHSSNGSFVNDTRVSEARLRPGDRLRLGDTVVELRAHEPYSPPGPPSGKTSRAGLAGTVPDTSLDDVLQMLVALRKDVTLFLGGERRAGCIRIAQGRVCQAAIRGASILPARKALYRMLAWRDVAFETHAAQVCEDAIRESLDSLLLEAARQRDELARLEPYLPAPGAVMVIVGDPPDATAIERDVVDAVTNHRLLHAVLNRSPLDDAQTAATLVSLQRRNVLLAVEPTRSEFVLPDARRAIFGRRRDPAPTPVEGTPTMGQVQVTLAKLRKD